MYKKILLAIGWAFVLSFVFLFYKTKADPRLWEITGQTMGTVGYSIKYMGGEDAIKKEEIDRFLLAFNHQLSTYIPSSQISKLNREGTLHYQSEYFYPVLSKSREVFEKTGGAFDPTIAPLVDAWGFGPNKQIPLMDSLVIDSLLATVGFGAVNFDEEKVTIPLGFRLNFGAIAKGYAVDLVGELLEEKGIEDYLVEIGGELRARGRNQDKKLWSLAIEDPRVSTMDRKLLAIVRVKNLSIATSGNYRNYYEKNEKIYAHIVDPRTGFTATHGLLSASVFAADCMTADAYATALMVLGMERSIPIIEKEPIEAILIYRDSTNEIRSYVSKGIRPFVEFNKAQ